MASFYPLRREGPLTPEAVAASLRAGASRQEALERRLAAPETPARRTHRALVAEGITAGEVLRIAAEAGAELDANNVATAIHKAAKAQGAAAVREDARFAALTSAGREHAEEWLPRQLCHVAWSLAMLHAGRSTLLAVVSEAFASHGAAEGVPQDISTFVWALAVVPFPDPRPLGSAPRNAVARLHEFCLQDLAITAWAYAKLACDDRRPLLECIAAESLPKMTSFIGRNLANLSWSYAAAQHRDLRLCHGLVNECAARVSELGPQELPITLWSFAAIAYPADSFFHAASRRIPETLHGMDVSHLCNVVWAYARAGPRSTCVFEVVADEVVGRLASMEPLHFSNLAWSFASASRADEFEAARSGVRHEPLFAGIAPAASRRPRELTPQRSASLIWAFATCVVTNGFSLLVSSIDTGIDGALHEFDPRHVAGILWAFAACLHAHEPLCAKLLDVVTQGGVDRLAHDGPAHLASITWATARLPFTSHRGLHLTLRSNVDGLLASLAGSHEELSEGRRQNIASVIRVLYDAGLAETARALLIRAEDADVAPGAEAWAAWLCGAAGAGDAELEARAWVGFARGLDGPRRTAALNAAAVRALAAGRPELGLAALDLLGEEGDALSALLWGRLGRPRRAPRGRTSPRGEYRQELRTALGLMAEAVEGDPRGLLAVAEAGDAHTHEVLGFAVGARGAALDAALQALEAPPQVVLELGCGIGCAAMRASQHLQSGGCVVACEEDALRAAIALCLVEWAGLTSTIHVWVGRGEQLLPRFRRTYGPRSLSALLLNSQGNEYQVDLAGVEQLGLWASKSVVVADHLLQPLAPEFMWIVCTPPLYRPTAVSVLNDWVLVSLRTAVDTGRPDDSEGAPLHPWPWPPPLQAVSQLRHEADEARRRTLGWRSRDRLAVGPPSLQPEEADAARAAYASVGIIPPVSWPRRDRGQWHVQLA